MTARRTMSSRPTGPPRPNVLLLIVDDLGMSGMQSASMPNVHSLARRGAFFHDAHAQMPNCAPSRVTLMLGLRPDTHRAYGLADHFRDTLPAATTLPQRFKQAGYLALSYGKVYHQLLDDEPSWSNERELRGIDQLNASRGGRRRGQRPWREWRYNQATSGTRPLPSPRSRALTPARPPACPPSPVPHGRRARASRAAAAGGPRGWPAVGRQPRHAPL